MCFLSTQGRSRPRIARRAFGRPNAPVRRAATVSRRSGLGDTVSIVHKKGVNYQKGEIFDCLTTRGGQSVSCSPGQQAIVGRLFNQAGYQTGSPALDHGTGFGTDLIAHGIGLANATSFDYRKCWKTQTDFQLVNMSNATAHVTIYFLKCRKSMAYTSDVAGDPAAIWTDLASQLTATNPVTTLGATPFDVGDFGRWFHIFKTKKYRMNPGQTKQFTVKTLEHFQYSWAKLGFNVDTTAPNNTIAGRTWGILAVVSGTIGVDSATPSLINTTAGRIGYSWVHKMWTSLNAHHQRANPLITNQLDGLSGGADILINDDVGAEEAYNPL